MSKHPAPACERPVARTAPWLAAMAAALLCMAPASAREDPGDGSAGLVPAALAAPAEMAVGGAALPYMDEGEGRPIAFLHGSISDRRVWEPLRETLAAEARFVAYDQRGFGTRDWPEGGPPLSADLHAADLIAFVEGLGAGPVELVTWSYSGDVGLPAPRARPDLFRAIIHSEPAPSVRSDGARAGRTATQTK